MFLVIYLTELSREKERWSAFLSADSSPTWPQWLGMGQVETRKLHFRLVFHLESTGPSTQVIYCFPKALTKSCNNSGLDRMQTEAHMVSWCHRLCLNTLGDYDRTKHSDFRCIHCLSFQAQNNSCLTYGSVTHSLKCAIMAATSQMTTLKVTSPTLR